MRLCIKGNKKETDKPFGIANICVADRVKESQLGKRFYFFHQERRKQPTVPVSEGNELGRQNMGLSCLVTFT